MIKNVRLLFVVFSLMQLPLLLKAQHAYLKMGTYTGNSATKYATGLIDLLQFSDSTSCSPCTAPALPLTERGVAQPGKIVFNLYANNPDVIQFKNLLFHHVLTPVACFVFTSLQALNAEKGYYWVVLSGVVVDDVAEVTNRGSGSPTAQVTLTYKAKTYYYQNFAASGEPSGARVSAGWDFVTNDFTILAIPAGL